MMIHSLEGFYLKVCDIKYGQFALSDGDDDCIPFYS
jgi:hypothetical protein